MSVIVLFFMFLVQYFYLLILERKGERAKHRFVVPLIYALIGCFFFSFVLKFFKDFYLFIFRERGREGERERNIDLWLPPTHPQLGTWPKTQACALTGNRTCNLSVLRPALSPLNHTSQGKWLILVCALTGD